MRIWHVGGLPSPLTVDGVSFVTWQVASEQALLGHRVSLLLDDTPDEAARTLAKKTGLELIHAPAGTWRYDRNTVGPLLRLDPPEIVHLHGTFSPRQAVLARDLVRNATPYVITPHGGINHRRVRIKKSVYTWMVEKYRFRNASAITVVAPQEEKALRAVVPSYEGPIRWVPNPVDTSVLDEQDWKGNVGARRLVFLGRFHVVNKGIDTLVKIGHLLPDVEIHLYGTEHAKTKRLLERLKRRSPANVRFHEPVFGLEKARVLSDASLYVQASRWEGFSISVAEAMYVGVPCAVADSLHHSELVHHAEILRGRDLGLVFPPDPNKAAGHLSEVLDQPDLLRHWSGQARAFARAHFHPRAAARNYLELYEEVLHA